MPNHFESAIEKFQMALDAMHPAENAPLYNLCEGMIRFAKGAERMDRELTSLRQRVQEIVSVLERRD